MQIMTPYPNFAVSAMVMDRSTLSQNNQTCATVINLLRGLSGQGEPAGEKRDELLQADVVRAWSGHLPSLCLFYSVMIREWENRGYETRLVPPYNHVDGQYVVETGHHASQSLPAIATDETAPPPPWIGGGVVHASHRSILLERNPEWYGKLDW